MRPNSLAPIVVFVAGLGIGYFVRGAMSTNDKTDTHAADLAAIEKLHKADIRATLAQNLTAMNSLWSEDAVKLDAPGSPVVGLKALREMYEKSLADCPDFKVLKYSPVITEVQIVDGWAITEVQIVDGWAIEVGTVEATHTMSAKDEPVSVSDKGVRVLKRQSDGSWKYAVVGLR
jgi:ketosteroid isomerase-like protein